MDERLVLMGCVVLGIIAIFVAGGDCRGKIVELGANLC